MARKHKVTRGGWRFEWEEGSRLADVFHPSKSYALDCVQVGGYDWRRGIALGTVDDLRAAAREWVKDYAEDYSRELAYL